MFRRWLGNWKHIVISTANVERWIASVLIVLLIALPVSLFVYWLLTPAPLPAWTGLGPSVSPSLSSGQTYQPGKTLWDWLDLFIVPVVLAIVAFAFNQAEKQRDREQQVQRSEESASLEEQRTQDTVLQAYFDHMTHLLLEKNLTRETEDDHIKSIARARTRTALRRLDRVRQIIIIHFLSDVDLLRGSSGLIELQRFDFEDAKLNLINFADTKLEEATFHNASLILANFHKAKLRNADFRNSQLVKADLSEAWLFGAQCAGAKLWRANLTKANASDSDFRTAQLWDAQLKHAIFIGANMEEADLSRVDASGANFGMARLKKAILREATLHGTQLQGADLHAAQLQNADLRAADLTGAKLRNTDFTGATVTGAIFIDADITDCKITPEQLATTRQR